MILAADGEKIMNSRTASTAALMRTPAARMAVVMVTPAAAPPPAAGRKSGKGQCSRGGLEGREFGQQSQGRMGKGKAVLMHKIELHGLTAGRRRCNGAEKEAGHGVSELGGM